MRGTHGKIVRFAQPFEEAPSRERRTGIPKGGSGSRDRRADGKMFLRNRRRWRSMSKQSQQVNAITFGQAE